METVEQVNGVEPVCKVISLRQLLRCLLFGLIHSNSQKPVATRATNAETRWGVCPSWDSWKDKARYQVPQGSTGQDRAGFFMGSITGLAAIQGVTDFQEVYQRIFFGGRQFYRIAIVIGRGLVS